MRKEQKKMKELNCKNCGAPLRSDGVCEYCGSVYQDISECAIEELRNKMANKITQCMLIQQSQDIINMTTSFKF